VSFKDILNTHLFNNIFTEFSITYNFIACISISTAPVVDFIEVNK